MKTTYSNPAPNDEDDLVAEYTFDYTKAKPNRFATRDSNSTIDLLRKYQAIACCDDKYNS